MCAPPTQKILLVIVLSHFSTFCTVTASSRVGRCRLGTSRRGGCSSGHGWCPYRSGRCPSRPGWSYESRRLYVAIPPPCISGTVTCSMSTELSDCLLPQFPCRMTGKCIPRSQYCNGIRDCIDGSDEMGCRTTSSDSTTTSTMLSVSVENTFSYAGTTSMMHRDTEVKTTPSSFTTYTSDMIFQEYEANTVSTSTKTSMIMPESGEDTTSPSTTTAAMFPDSKVTTTFSSFTTVSTIFQEFDANTISSSTTTSVIQPETEYDTSSSSTKVGTLVSNSEENTIFSSFAAGNTLLSKYEDNISSLITDNTMLPEYAEKTSSRTTDNTIPPEYEENASSLRTNTMAPTVYEDNTSSPTRGNLMLRHSSVRRLCPDKYCMQNAECIIVKGQYRCNCPSSYIGEHCEIQQGFKQGSHEYIVAIVIFMSLVVLCSTVLTVCIYRYKRLSAWKSNDTTYRTLSQLTLTHDME